MTRSKLSHADRLSLHQRALATDGLTEKSLDQAMGAPNFEFPAPRMKGVADTSRRN